MPAIIYKWFLEPKDENTNRCLSNSCERENFKEVRCADGKEHPLWQCTEVIRDFFVASRANLTLKFEVFCQEGNGKIRNVSFLFKKKKKSMRKATA